MNTPKKPGRPSGTDYREDNFAMELMAEALVAGRAKTAAEAARMVYKNAKCPGASEDAIVARLGVKWRAEREKALIRARGRVQKVTPSVPAPRDIGAATPLRATAVAIAMSHPDRRSDQQKLLDSALAKSMAEWPRGGLARAGQSRSVQILAAQDAFRDAQEAVKAMGGFSELRRREKEIRASIDAAGGLGEIKRQIDQTRASIDAAGGLTEIKRQMEQARATMRDFGPNGRRRDG